EMIARKITKVKPDLLELNLSCPHSASAVGKSFAVDADLAAETVRAVKKIAKQPVLAKLSPNNHKLKEMGLAVEEAGADGITAINTLGPGMVIDVVSGRPILANKFGGVSGPAIKPIAVRCVYDLYSVVKIPILGTGGVSTGEDVVEMMMAGASAVGMGSSVFTRGIEVFNIVNAEVTEFLNEQGYSSLKEVIGLAHEGGSNACFH
ncbi:MAG: dihydroorotate dehydrogenase, partial [Candidatus Diapherotrites archaeon]|nr:dihydroorotate dehydrogenase [Candidatus Diapherotrites archaeon]